MSTRDRLKTWARRIKRDGLTLWFAGKHPRTPWHAKALGVFVVAYALSPSDLIPDFIPVAGYADDFAALMAAYSMTKACVTTEIKAQANAKCREWFKDFDDAEAEASIDRSEPDEQ